MRFLRSCNRDSFFFFSENDFPHLYAGGLQYEIKGCWFEVSREEHSEPKISFYKRGLSNEVPISKQQISWHWQFKMENNEYIFLPFSANNY